MDDATDLLQQVGVYNDDALLKDVGRSDGDASSLSVVLSDPGKVEDGANGVIYPFSADHEYGFDIDVEKEVGGKRIVSSSKTEPYHLIFDNVPQQLFQAAVSKAEQEGWHEAWKSIETSLLRELDLERRRAEELVERAARAEAEAKKFRQERDEVLAGLLDGDSMGSMHRRLLTAEERFKVQKDLYENMLSSLKVELEQKATHSDSQVQTLCEENDKLRKELKKIAVDFDKEQAELLTRLHDVDSQRISADMTVAHLTEEIAAKQRETDRYRILAKAITAEETMRVVKEAAEEGKTYRKQQAQAKARVEELKKREASLRGSLDRALSEVSRLRALVDGDEAEEFDVNEPVDVNQPSGDVPQDHGVKPELKGSQPHTVMSVGARTDPGLSKGGLRNQVRVLKQRLRDCMRSASAAEEEAERKHDAAQSRIRRLERENGELRNYLLEAEHRLHGLEQLQRSLHPELSEVTQSPSSVVQSSPEVRPTDTRAADPRVLSRPPRTGGLEDTPANSRSQKAARAPPPGEASKAKADPRAAVSPVRYAAWAPQPQRPLPNASFRSQNPRMNASVSPMTPSQTTQPSARHAGDSPTPPESTNPPDNVLSSQRKHPTFKNDAEAKEPGFSWSVKVRPPALRGQSQLDPDGDSDDDWWERGDPSSTKKAKRRPKLGSDDENEDDTSDALWQAVLNRIGARCSNLLKSSSSEPSGAGESSSGPTQPGHRTSHSTSPKSPPSGLAATGDSLTHGLLSGGTFGDHVDMNRPRRRGERGHSQAPDEAFRGEPARHAPQTSPKRRGSQGGSPRSHGATTNGSGGSFGRSGRTRSRPDVSPTSTSEGTLESVGRARMPAIPPVAPEGLTLPRDAVRGAGGRFDDVPIAEASPKQSPRPCKPIGNARDATSGFSPPSRAVTSPLLSRRATESDTDSVQTLDVPRGHLQEPLKAFTSEVAHVQSCPTGSSRPPPRRQKPPGSDIALVRQVSLQRDDFSDDQSTPTGVAVPERARAPYPPKLLSRDESQSVEALPRGKSRKTGSSLPSADGPPILSASRSGLSDLKQRSSLGSSTTYSAAGGIQSGTPFMMSPLDVARSAGVFASASTAPFAAQENVVRQLGPALNAAAVSLGPPQ